MCQTTEGLSMDHRNPDPPVDKDDILLCVGSIHDDQAKAAGEAGVTAHCETDMLHRDLLEIEANTVTLPPTSTTTPSEQQHSRPHSATHQAAQEAARPPQSQSGGTPQSYLSSAATYMYDSPLAHHNHLSTDSESWVQGTTARNSKPTTSHSNAHRKSDPEATSGEHDDGDDWSLAAERSQTSDQHTHTSTEADK